MRATSTSPAGSTVTGPDAGSRVGADPDAAAAPATVTVPEWGRTGEAGPTAPLIAAGSEAATRLPAVDLALPDLDDLDEPVEVREPLRGAAASWAAGYRDGFREGTDEGRARGLEQGLAEGRDLALDRLRADLAAVRAGVAAALAGEEERHRREIESLEAHVVDLALAIAEAVLDRHVLADEDATRHAIRRALELGPDRGAARVRLHPDDADLLAAAPPPAPGRDVELVPDASVRRGGCVVEVGGCVVDADVDGALARVREVLST